MLLGFQVSWSQHIYTRQMGDLGTKQPDVDAKTTDTATAHSTAKVGWHGVSRQLLEARQRKRGNLPPGKAISGVLSPCVSIAEHGQTQSMDAFLASFTSDTRFHHSAIPKTQLQMALSTLSLGQPFQRLKKPLQRASFLLEGTS